MTDDVPPENRNDWPRSVFAHIEPGFRHPKAGKLFGLLGLLIGAIPLTMVVIGIGIALTIDVASKAKSDYVFNAVGGAFFFSFLACGGSAMCYKFAHELGALLCSEAAYNGFNLATIAMFVSLPCFWLIGWTGLIQIR